MIVQRLDSRSGGQRLKEWAQGGRALLRRLRWSRKPPWKGFGEPLNGQRIRREVFEDLFAQFSPTALVETGTFVASTTRYLVGLGVDTYTVEVNPGFQAVARVALRGAENVTMICGDSVAGLRCLAGEGKIERPLAYLDAHWEERVPLAEELDCLFASWDEVIAVIDDFHVPGEPGYAYDIYAGVPLSADGISLPADALLAYPAAPAAKETGARRGTAFVARGDAARSAFESAASRGMIKIQRGEGLSAVGADEESVDLK